MKKYKTRLWRGVLLGFALLTGQAIGKTNLVSSTGDGSDGSTWTTAFTSLQAALNVAVSNDQIFIAGGVYPVSSQILWTVSGVSIYGGYQGSGSPGNRNPTNWPTIFRRSDDLATNRMLYINGMTKGRLDGITMTNGYASGNGGVGYIENVANLAFVNCNFIGNQSASFGGALYINNTSGLLFENCLLWGNSTSNNAVQTSGGAIYANYSSGVITNCAFVSNGITALRANIARKLVQCSG